MVMIHFDLRDPMPTLRQPFFRLILFGCFFGLLTLGLGCGGYTDNADRVRITTTTGIIADAVRNVAGEEHFVVESLMSPGVDPHRYLPSPGDVRKLGRAEVIFYNGLDLEGKLTDILQARHDRTGNAYALADALEPDELRFTDHRETTHDPHIWLDVKLWAKCVESIRDKLTEHYPEHGETFANNTAAYIENLQALDQELHQMADTVPAGRRVLVTSHDAFGYFGAAYGFEVYGLQGVSTASETTTRDVLNLANLLGTRQVPAVFTESSVPGKGLQTVLAAVREKYNWEVRLIHGEEALYSDSLGPAGCPADNYIGMMRHNMAVITGELSK